MSGAVDTFKGAGLIVHVIKEADSWAVVARCGRREGVIAQRGDRRSAKALARSVVACETLPGFRDWLAGGGTAPMGDAF